jgi:hypothetical protein
MCAEIKMAISRSTAAQLEPFAQGRKAFWDGRAIWTNPLTGIDARAWTAGWKQALGELSVRRGGRVLGASAAETAAWHALLALYRPEDVAPRARRRAVRTAAYRAQRA